MWTCPDCGRAFAARNQTHTCAPLATLEDQRFTRIQTFSARNHVHAFRLSSPDEVDERVAAWLREAYDVGMQRHR
jgi:hypothetical protein